MKCRVLAVATVTVLVACLGRDADGATPKRGGKIVVGSLAAMRQLDPHKTNSAEEYPPTFWMYNGLARLRHDGNPEPDLAVDWKPNDDLTRWTVRLRKGVLFHNGREMTSEDVVASYRRLLDKATASLGRSMLTMIESMSAPDRHTVEFTLNTPYFEFPKALGTIQAKVAPKETLDSLAEKPGGTGPFKLVQFIPGDMMRLVRNDKYFVQGQPYLDEVVYKVFPEPLVATTTLKQGGVDIISNMPVDTVPDLQRAGSDVVVESAATNNWDAIFLHNKRKPYSDLKFRLALNYATDKQKLVDTALFGAGTPVDSPIAPTSPVFNKDLPLRRQDIAKAKQLLAEAGYPSGVDLTLFAPVGRANRERLALAVQEMWKAAGIRVKVERVPWDKFVADIELKADAYASGYAGRATIDHNLYAWLTCDGSYNMFHYCNPELDQLLNAGRRTRSLEDQKRIYGRVQQVLHDNPPGVIAWVSNAYSAHRRHVQNYRIHPLWGHLYLDSVWLDK
jgi:peptide/nickel transport system substrate-binding protein